MSWADGTYTQEELEAMPPDLRAIAELRMTELAERAQAQADLDWYRRAHGLDPYP